MPETNHIVNRIAVNTTGISTEKAFKWRAQVADYLNNDFPRQLQAILDEVYSPEEQIIIDRLEININLPDTAGTMLLQRELLQALKKELSYQKPTVTLPEKQEGTGNITQPLHRQAEAWLFYLQNGFYPWYHQEVFTQKQIEILVQLQTVFIAEKLPSVLYAIRAQQRFFMMLSASIIDALLPCFVSSKGKRDSYTYEKQQDLQKSGIAVAEIIKQVFLKVAIAGISISEEQFSKQVREAQYLNPPGYAEDKSIENKPALRGAKHDKEDAGADEKKSIWIHNAGLVLVHPFLPVLFERLSILNKQKEITNRAKALALIHYLLYADDEYADAKMILPKILCGIDYREALVVEPITDNREKEECNELLLSVIEYWEALKKTSVNGLLETFIQRKGKLTRRKNDWYLQVENRTEDILLDRLPWTIGLIKLPWMANTLTTEWR